MALTTSCDPVQPEPLDQACGRQDRPRALMGVSPLNPEMFVYIYIYTVYVYTSYGSYCNCSSFFTHLSVAPILQTFAAVDVQRADAFLQVWKGKSAGATVSVILI